jgi:ribosomal protein S21
MAQVTKREGESVNSLIFRFIKRVKQTGVLMESRKRRFRQRAPNKLKRKLSALHRVVKKAELEMSRKMGEETKH